MYRSCYLLVGIFFCVLTAQSQQAVKPVVVKTPLQHTPAWSGEQMFRTYCASCHGVDAKGNGPAAPALKAGVPDLTLISQRNGGKYPELKVVNAIKGDPHLLVHGSKDMPVWGTLLRSGATPDGEDALRVSNLTHYIETLQK